MNKRSLDDDQKFLAHTIELAVGNVKSGGGPFGAVVVSQGKIISEGTNLVTLTNDPTAHAEITAIRKASEKLDSYSLEGCTIYSSTEPCPMCLGAIYWAGMKRLVFASSRADAEKAGFQDAHIYRELGLEIDKRSISTQHVAVPGAGDEFIAWNNSVDKRIY